MVQLPQCAELMRQEIENFQPKKILFLTGIWWIKDFINFIPDFQISEEMDGLVEGIGTYSLKNGSITKIVVAKHPQGKPEENWINEVIKSFSVSNSITRYSRNW